jgi:hypothetical protein
MLSMARSAKVATPADAASVVAPESVPADGLVAIAMVTLPVNRVARSRRRHAP